MQSALEIVPPLLQCTDDRQHLLVMDFVVPLNHTEAFGEEGDQMPLLTTIRGLLGQDCSGGCIGGVCFDTVRAGVVQEGKDRGRGDQLLQHVKGSLFQPSPFPSNILLGEVEQGMGMVGEVLDEPLVEVDKSDKGLDLFLVPRYGPLCHTGDLDWVHLHRALRNNHSKVLYLEAFELALLRLEVQLVFSETL